MKENQHIEYKSNFNDSVIETLVAFANSKGGKVLIGVNDNGSPNVNFSYGKETFQKWINDIKLKTQPSIIPDLEVVDYKKNKIVELTIQEFPIKPISFKGRYYKRIKNSNHQLSVIEIADLSMQSLQVSWDSYPSPNASIKDIDFKKAEKFIQKVNNIGSFNLEGTTIENLEKLKLISNSKITNAAFLLFSKNDIPYNVHLGRFKTPSYIIDDKMLRGSLFEVVEETMNYLISQIKVAFEITGMTTQRTEIFEYPLPALRELVLNALIHRDYLSPIDVQIKIFDQSISIFNPSGLFGNLSIEDLKTDNYRASTRNKLIAEAFYLTKDIEKYGSGFIRIRKAIADYPTMKFYYKEIANGFLAELSYSIQKISTKKDTENDTENDTEKRLKSIIEYIKRDKSISTNSIAIRLNISRSTVVRNLNVLKEKGIIKRIGPDKGGHWAVI